MDINRFSLQREGKEQPEQKIAFFARRDEKNRRFVSI
jgi:hypothetical protein